jgi:hypothetical protein
MTQAHSWYEYITEIINWLWFRHGSFASYHLRCGSCLAETEAVLTTKHFTINGASPAWLSSWSFGRCFP